MQQRPNPRSLELFSGAGGLALGLALAGFDHQLLAEWDKQAVHNLLANQAGAMGHLLHGKVSHTDVRELDYTPWQGRVDLLAGGPPCQPFSLGGKHKGHLDQRDMFPEAARAIAALRPKAFILENVKGLTRASFKEYFDYILLRLSWPELIREVGIAWEDHLEWLRGLRGHRPGTLHYRVKAKLLNAADFGVPQQRERVIFIGVREDLAIEPSFPAPTHSWEALLKAQFADLSYWARHQMKPDLHAHLEQLGAGLSMDRAKALAHSPNAEKLPWATVRDALTGLHAWNPQRRTPLNHEPRAGARAYPGHTGSYIDLPSKTLKAGDHGVPGGENMLRLLDGSVRYFSAREAARMQTFPDQYVFHGSWTETMRQIGNAVPVRLAEVLGRHLHQTIFSHHGPQEQLRVQKVPAI